MGTMIRFAGFFLLAYAGGSPLSASPADSEVVFRSDVSLVRVDAQVVDAANRAVTDLHAEDFVLREAGQLQPIRNFASEDMPVDVLLLLDVSASMGPHVQRIANASQRALTVLGTSDRMGIMVFDRSTRVRLPFSNSRQELQHELDRLLRQERFDGGTDITRAVLDAAYYIRREGRRDARRAIIILTDDQTEFDRNEAAVSRALTGADAVLSALIAPDAMQFGRYSARVAPRRGGMGSPVAGISGFLVSVHTQSAGTDQIARSSGGDSMSVDQASALEDTLWRIRQRYTLFFSLPEGVKPGEERNIEVSLANSTRLRFPGAEVRYRRVYMMPSAGAEAALTSVTPAPGEHGYPTSSPSSTDSDDGKSRAQPSNPRGSWLMQNYHFIDPPPAFESGAIDTVVSELQQIQNTVLAILRKADFAKDYEAALAAASQATANAQLITSLIEHQQPPKTGQADAADVKSGAPIYLIALKDKTIDAATSYWVEGFFLNYISLKGAHVIVRLDIVDRSFTSELNRQRGLELRLPEMSR